MNDTISNDSHLDKTNVNVQRIGRCIANIEAYRGELNLVDYIAKKYYEYKQGRFSTILMTIWVFVSICSSFIFSMEPNLKMSLIAATGVVCLFILLFSESERKVIYSNIGTGLMFVLLLGVGSKPYLLAGVAIGLVITWTFVKLGEKEIDRSISSRKEKIEELQKIWNEDKENS